MIYQSIKIACLTLMKWLVALHEAHTVWDVFIAPHL